MARPTLDHRDRMGGPPEETFMDYGKHTRERLSVGKALGTTLLLLVVGAIVVSLYEPTESAHETANRVKCASNMRQIAQAL